MIDNTIKTVVNDGLCTGCGTCISMCPKDAISISMDKKHGVYVPIVDALKCNKCGTCYKICPGYDTNFDKLNQEIFGHTPENNLIGNYFNCYVGHSTHYDIRYNSSSGGLVTQFLLFALDKGVIDGVLITRMSEDRPLEPESFIARTKAEIINASGSKYCPVPANIAIKQIMDETDGKFAVVGLPCHIHGIRKAEINNEKLRGKIVLHLGLFCHHGVSFAYNDFLLKKLKINSSDITKIYYRSFGWPGKMRFDLKNNGTLLQFMNIFWSYPSTYLFTPQRCMFCSDALAELADVSFGDAWRLKISAKDRIGCSLIITRHKLGEKLLLDMKEKGDVNIKTIHSYDVIHSQKSALYFKKRNIIIRMKLNKTAYKHADGTPTNILDYFLYLLFINLHQKSSANEKYLNVFRKIPFKILKVYVLPYYIIATHMKLKK